MGKTRAGSNRHLVRRARLDALRTNWLVLLAFTALIGGLCAGGYHLPGGKEWHAFVLGVFLTLGIVGELTAVHLASGTHQRSLGVFGESSTADAVCGT